MIISQDLWPPVKSQLWVADTEKRLAGFSHALVQLV